VAKKALLMQGFFMGHLKPEGGHRENTELSETLCLIHLDI